MIEHRSPLPEYNYHDWSRFMVLDAKTKPTNPHFAAVLLETRSEWTRGYDNDDGYSSTHPNVVYFAFPDKKTLEAWVLRAAKDKKVFFFFEVKKVGEAELKVNVDLDV